MQPERDAARVLDLLLAAGRVREFISGQDFESFGSDLKTQAAVTFEILILGEAAKRLSPEFRARHTEIEWSGMMRMRDKLIHHYEVIDLAELWRTATHDVPAMAAAVEPLAPRDAAPEP
jgi:uncharacterized protein with HEPN domain